ncbi:MAG TPA: ATP-dependent helicase [Treponemataceae bacterium]|nr:ATP-dependent helicase [Treponemataceae bacterium]
MSMLDSVHLLNPEQLEAVQHEGSPLLILAGAGSGKTRVITTKIAYLISEKGFLPSSILAVTFTKKAAKEMTERAQKLEPLSVHSQIRTFHSFGSWFLRLHHQEAGVDPNFTVYDDDDVTTLIRKAIPALSKQEASHLAHKISLAKDYCLESDSEDLVHIDNNPEFPEYYAAYEKRLRETGNVDFGDLIMLPVLVMRMKENIRSYMHSRFKVIMVDEYQDSNVAQFALLQQLTGPSTYVCVVGDDDQSIYKFRGAEVKNILTFADHFPGTKVIKLQKNYRSVSPILSVADAVVKNNKERLGKTLEAVREGGKKPVIVFLPNQDDETAFCAEMIQKTHRQGVPYSHWAILYRTNAQSLGFETEFLHRKIPYAVVGSLKFYEREEIKDVLSFLAFIANRKDEVSFRRIINKPARGIGLVTQDKIVDLSRKESAVSLMNDYNIFDACCETSTSASKKAREGLQSFIDIVSELIVDLGDRDNRHLSSQAALFAAAANPSLETTVSKPSEDEQKLSAFIEKLIRLSGFAEYYQAQDEITGTQRVSNLQELVNSAMVYPKNREGLLEFLDHIELDRTLELENEDDGDKDAVTLITIHNTKGLEFPRVILTGMEHGIFPRRDKTEEELEEERRLFYVGITRAKDELYLTSCAMRRIYGSSNYMEISPFLLEAKGASVDVIGTQPSAFKRSAAPAVSSGNPLYVRWRKGVRLFHDDYGYGCIIDTDDSDDDYVISVQFETGEIKRFLPKYQASKLLIVND